MGASLRPEHFGFVHVPKRSSEFVITLQPAWSDHARLTVGLINTLESVYRHPLNRSAPWSALWNFGRWQISQRLYPRRALVPWVRGTRLIVGASETGLTGNLYCGLHEFADMAFALHYLRATDLFVDVGANAGSYTVLAAGAAGAEVIAIEPVPHTFDRLLDNIHVNRLGLRVRTLNCAVGAATGMTRFATDADTLNRVLLPGESRAAEIAVPVQKLDDIIGTERGCFIKLDVEGFEAPVLEGARALLRAGRVRALLVELNGSGTLYGRDDATLDAELRGFGLQSFVYEPFERLLVPAARGCAGNTLYLLDPADAAARVLSAARFKIGRHDL